jgi:multisubunit Na+/H+ antiporter MnhE subunit
MLPLMRRLLTLVVWWGLLVLLWIAYVGTVAGTELAAGVLAALVAAVALETVRAQGLLHFRTDRVWLLRVWKAPAQIVYDFVLLSWLLVRALARRQRIRGEFLTTPFPTGDLRAAYAWRRAWVTTLGTMSPNVLVVDLDVDDRTAVLHSLDPEAWAGKEPL